MEGYVDNMFKLSPFSAVNGAVPVQVLWENLKAKQ
jgi:hypothetical protein